jgi:hypothetical protein
MRRVAAWLAAALVTVLAASCVSVLGAGDYAGAATSLCDLLAQCYGGAAYPDCAERVASGLDGSDAELRAQFLGAFSDKDCLRNCSSARACLDLPPVCEDGGSACTQLEDCCGFTANASACGQGACCLPDGQACGPTSPCCSACNAVTGTCGAIAPCADVGASCERNSDCCSFNCSDNVCALTCRREGENCDQPGECCTDRCVDGFCACRDLDEACEFFEQCCTGYCNPDLGRCDVPTCGVLFEPCDNGCCEPLACPFGYCCYPDGAECSTDPSLCCGQGCQDGLCCSLLGQLCDDGSECCVGSCNGSYCDCSPDGGPCAEDEDCCGQSCKGDTCGCNAPTCHDGCVKHPSPLSPANDCAGQAGAVTPACIEEVCSIAPYCCCREWDAQCVDLVPLLPSCMGACLTDPI